MLWCVDKPDPMVFIFEKLCSCFHRPQDPTFPLFSQIFLYPAFLCHQSHQRFRLMRVELIHNKDPLPFRIFPDCPLDMPGKICFRPGCSDRWLDDLARDDAEVSD